MPRRIRDGIGNGRLYLVGHIIQGDGDLIGQNQFRIRVHRLNQVQQVILAGLDDNKLSRCHPVDVGFKLGARAPDNRRAGHSAKSAL
ncbi:hypothetical protein [Xenorhabdus szentirmaii]|uniref:hypothetical protein n=1 Tax=Xenorhabdus szentirmaii TaxID=290112 RepID=UPI002B40AC07|nr:hypothetical protein [Xenorhabdus sp. 38]